MSEVKKITCSKNMFHISVAIASFANFVPEIVELLGNRPKYAGTYEVRIIKTQAPTGHGLDSFYYKQALLA